jgi:O-antigen/teichoic acid export membrane protein
LANIFHKILKHGAVYGIGAMLPKIVGFALLPIYTKFLDPTAYGILQIFNVTSELSIVIILQGITHAFFKFYLHDYKEQPNVQRKLLSTSYFYILLCSFLLFGCLSLFPSNINSLMFKDSNNVHLMTIVFITAFFGASCFIPSQLFRAEFESLKYTIVHFTRFLVNVSLNIYLVVFCHMGIEGVIYGNLVAAIFASVLSFILIYPKLSFDFSFKLLNPMIKYGLPYMPSGLAIWVLSMSDRYFIEHFSTTTELGLYSICYKISSLLPLLLIRPITRTWDAIFFPLAKQQGMSKTFSKVYTYYMLFACMLALCMICMVKPLLALMTDEQFWGAYVAMPFLAIGHIMFGLKMVCSVGIQVKNKTQYEILIVGIPAGANLLLNLYLIPLYGMIGAALATAASYFFMAMLSIYYNNRFYPVEFQILRLFKILVVFISLIVLWYVIESDSMSYEVFKGTVIILAYPLLLLVLAFLTKSEVRKIKLQYSLIKEKFKLLLKVN